MVFKATSLGQLQRYFFFFIAPYMELFSLDACLNENTGLRFWFFQDTRSRREENFSLVKVPVTAYPS